jgi:hypothetical protein
VVIEGEKPRGIWVLVKEQRMVKAQELPETSLTVVVNGGGNQAARSSSWVVEAAAAGVEAADGAMEAAAVRVSSWVLEAAAAAAVAE